MKLVKKALAVVVVALRKAITICVWVLNILPAILARLRETLEQAEKALREI